ncbi:hypothetical protein BGW41_004081 [Actinomortierella wolfii]|nr:hypothetical protein BGW41_004081 [Actinomortierella wolfii]
MKFLSLLVVACLAASSTADAAATFIPGPSGKSVPGKYIVMLKEDVAVSPIDSIENKINEISRRRLKNSRGFGARRLPKIVRRFENLNGFAIEDAQDDLQELLNLPEVDYIEEDSVYEIAATQKNPPSWGLPRITQRDILKDPKAQFKYPSKAGSGITAYVVDTGIYAGHSDFEKRARFGANFVKGSPDADEHGHGTHVAGTLGGKTYGVAKKVNLVGVKVLNKEGTGDLADIIAGIDWVAKDAKGKRALVNLSIHGRSSQAMNDAVNRLANKKIPIFAAAGNVPMDACEGSPSGAPNTFTVAASDFWDRTDPITSYGKCVEMIAPGVDITSAWIGSSTASKMATGSSMASPHAAGVAAILMSVNSTLTHPKDVYKTIINASTRNKILGVDKGTPNKFLYLEN